MTTIEEQIWDYVDGCGDADYRSEIHSKIASQQDYKQAYEDVMAIHQQLQHISLEEPSMSFTRNVMELVKLEVAPVSLRTKVDNRIIYSIAAFFILAMLAIFVYTVSQSHFSMPKSDLNLGADLSSHITPMMIKAFLFIDIIIAFLYLDRLLRKLII